MRYRLDELLVRKGLCETRSQAQLLIKEGKVLTVNGIAQKPGQKLSETAKIVISTKDQYVSRGAYKIKTAIEGFNINLKDKIIVDVGSSTGGFTDYVLQNNAKKVYAIDVGHGQLAKKLKEDKRVVNMEGVDIRNVKSLPEKADILVADLSYISLKLVLKNMSELVKDKGKMICLFKPQFEAGKGAVPKDGVIKDEIFRGKILQNFLSWCEKEGYSKPRIVQSQIKGGDGNIEYLLYFRK
jgi:23S rRNA (cytidine1920-2'-O)/16S rRNA (cytidine1409-2'-O)-methyltransferase